MSFFKSKALDPKAIAARDARVALKLGKPENPKERRRETPEMVKWMEEHFGAPFKDVRAAMERVRREYEESKRRAKP